MRQRGSRIPVMRAKCATCPFGPKGDVDVRHGVESRLATLAHSQMCHHPRLHGKPETHACRGGRDYQLTLLHRLGLLSAPTDEEFDKESTRHGA